MISSLRSSLSYILIVNKICSAIFSTNSLFNNKDLLNFHKSFPWKNSLIWFNEKRIGEWFVVKEAKMSVLSTRSCKKFDWNLLWMKPEEWFWRKIYRLNLGLLTLQILHRFILSSISINIVGDFCFKTGLPPHTSRLQLNTKFKFSPRIIFV